MWRLNLNLKQNNFMSLHNHQKDISAFLLGDKFERPPTGGQSDAFPSRSGQQKKDDRSSLLSGLNNAPQAPTKEGKTKKRIRMTSNDRDEKTFHLERENNELKEKSNLLTREITTMQTKLRRIEALINQRSKCGDNTSLNLLDVQADLQHECDSLKVQNSEAKEKIRKLTVIERGLATRPAGATIKVDKYAYVQGKLEQGQTSAMRRYAEEADDMRAQLVINDRKKVEMERQLEILKTQTRGYMGPADATKLRSEIQNMMQEQRDIEGEMFLLENDQKQREMMFKDSRNFVTEIQQKLRDANAENERLKQENFRLQIKTQQVTDFEQELQLIEKERDDIERSIKNILSEPFMKKTNEKPITQRIEDLKMQKNNIETESRKFQQHKKDLEERITAKKAQFQKQTYERDTLEVDYSKAKEEFTELYGNRGPTEEDAVKGLISMEPGKYTNMLADLVMGDAPSWAKLDFLERDRAIIDSGPNGVKVEIQYLTQEKADLAGELEKAQNLLRLQKDIQYENDEFYRREIERLTLVENSAKNKLAELARQSDEKSRLLFETQKKIDQNQARFGSPLKTHHAGAENLDDSDVMSEFSVATNETALEVNENILDFKLEDAEYFFDSFNQVPAISHLKAKDGSQFITLLTVDFFNCPSETTGLAVGYGPNYNTQISFKNKVDKFYLSNLERGTIKIDCYVSKNNAAVHVGQSQILLKELLNEIQITEAKSTFIQQYARIYPLVSGVDVGVAATGKATPIGIVKYKMRLRRPVFEAWKYARNQQDIDDITKMEKMNQQSLKPSKKLVTISVVRCENLQTAYESVRNVEPFFFYQFYTFDDRYSKNGMGVNPEFHDTYSYEVNFDSKAVSYFERELLEIFIFDDKAPITGKELNGKANQNDDMIGVARIPLKTVAQGASIHEKFPVYEMSTKKKVGLIEVKISVTDLEALAAQSLKPEDLKNFHFNKEWEQDIISKIAAKLAPFNCEVELLFGIFSQGQRTCTKEDFSYCCLNRIGLRQSITKKEMDLFLTGTEVLKGKDFIERDDFARLFSNAVIKARHEMQCQISQTLFKGTLNDRLNESHASLNQSQYQSKMTHYLTQLLYDTLGPVVKHGFDIAVMKECEGKYDVSVQYIKKVLCDKGQLLDVEANNVIANLSLDHRKDFVLYLESVFANVKSYWLGKSEAARKIRETIARNPGRCIKLLEEQDYNKDAELNVNGFKSAFLLQEFNLKKDDIEEAFYLYAKSNGMLPYHEWLESLNTEYHNLLSKEIHQHVVHQKTVQHDSSKDQLRTDISGSLTDTKKFDATILNPTTVQIAQTKFENYIRSQEDLSLGVVFAILDTNTNQEISFNEFRAKIYQMDMRLSDEEINALFRSLDVNGTGTITYLELVEKFSALNNAQILKRIKNLIFSGKSSPDFIFDKYSQDKTRGRMLSADFSVMIKDFVKKSTPQEVQSLWKHFDKGNKSYITRHDFVAAFESEIKDQTFSISIEDIIKPLATKLKKFNTSVTELFESADSSKNYRISAQELATAIEHSTNHKMTLDPAEIKMIDEYFYNRFHHKEVNRAEFIELFSTKFTNKFDEQEAKKSLATLKTKCETQKINIWVHMEHHNPEKSAKINLKSFKMALNDLRCLTLYQIDNLAKYMDTENEGFISLDNFASQVQNTLDASMKQRTLTSTRRSEMDRSFKKSETTRTNKWQ